MATTATALTMSSGAVVVPFYGDENMNRDVSAIVARVAPDEDERQETAQCEEPEGLIAAAEDIMDVLGSYVGGPVSDSASKVEKAVRDAERRAKANLLAQAIRAFVEQL